MIRYGWWIGMAVSAVLCGRFALHTFQLESYQLGGYFRAMKRVGARMFAPGLIAGGVTSAAVVLLTGESTPDWLMWLLLAAAVALSALLFLRQKSAPAKKPLVVTPRVKRLVGFWLAVSLCATALSPLMPLTLLATPLWLALAALLALPVEKYIQYLYRRDAMKRLDAMPDLIKIGVTGSYGKTSAKFLLETILSEKYRVLVTPASFNTSMGVTRAIRERLAPEHQVFVAEMGSRHPGDIALLCKMVRPKYGILNSVGPQHLETFHTQEAILNEKFTLARAIPPDGAMVFGADGGLNDGLYEKADC